MLAAPQIGIIAGKAETFGAHTDGVGVGGVIDLAIGLASLLVRLAHFRRWGRSAMWMMMGESMPKENTSALPKRTHSNLHWVPLLTLQECRKPFLIACLQLTVSTRLEVPTWNLELFAK